MGVCPLEKYIWKRIQYFHPFCAVRGGSQEDSSPLLELSPKVELIIPFLSQGLWGLLFEWQRELSVSGGRKENYITENNLICPTHKVTSRTTRS